MGYIKENRVLRERSKKLSKEEKKKIKVAFPHMGDIYVAWATALNSLGVEAFLPPHTSKKTLSLGVKYSPEAICLPYKLVLGNFIEAVEEGADYVVMITSPGICRLGEYGKLMKTVLAEMPGDAKYIELELYDGFKAMYRFLTEISGVKNPLRIVKALILTIRKVFIMDRMQEKLSYFRAREINHGHSERIYERHLKKLLNCLSIHELGKVEKEFLKDLQKVELDPNREVLTVDITGEIFMVLDSFANQDIEKELGRMGVQTRRSLTVSSWIRDAITPKLFKQGETHLERAVKFARPYLKRDIGGDALESVSDMSYAHFKGTDGLIHISPFTCMPEIMSQNIFPAVKEDVDIPVLTLIMDEQTGRAGFITRLEAFVDLMRRRKRKLAKDKADKEKAETVAAAG